MALLFVSYRRGDSTTAAERVCDHLRKAFGEGSVFKDVDNIDPATPWDEKIDEHLSKCKFLVVVIGRGWVGAAAGG